MQYLAPREQTLHPSQIAHPQYVDGNTLWIDPEVQEIITKLHYGDATLGWEGDPRLALYRGKQGQWFLYREEESGMYPVCQSRPGVHLDNRLIMRLVEHDHRRGFDPGSLLMDSAGNPLSGPDNYEAIREAHEKVVHAAAKDLGIV